MHLSDKLTPLVPIDIFVLNDSEDSTENEDKHESKKSSFTTSYTKQNRGFKKVADGTSKDNVFPWRLET